MKKKKELGTVVVEYRLRSYEGGEITLKAESSEVDTINEVLGALFEKIRINSQNISHATLEWARENDWVSKTVREFTTGYSRQGKDDFTAEERELFCELGLPLPFEVYKVETGDKKRTYLPHSRLDDRRARKTHEHLTRLITKKKDKLEADDLAKISLDGIVGRLRQYYGVHRLDLLPEEWDLLRRLNMHLKTQKIFVKDRIMTVKYSLKNNIRLKLYNSLLADFLHRLNRRQDELSDTMLEYLSNAMGINKFVKKIQLDMEGDYVYFNSLELEIIDKIRIKVLSRTVSLTTKEGVAYLFHYRAVDGQRDQILQDLQTRIQEYQVRDPQMKILHTVGFNKLVSMIQEDVNHEKVIEDTTLRRIFSGMGIKLNSKYFVSRSLDRESVTFYVPEDGDGVKDKIYKAIVDNSHLCTSSELNTLRVYGVEKIFDHTAELPENIERVLSKMSIDLQACKNPVLA